MTLKSPKKTPCGSPYSPQDVSTCPRTEHVDPTWMYIPKRIRGEYHEFNGWNESDCVNFNTDLRMILDNFNKSWHFR